MNTNELSIDVKKVIDTFLTPPDPFRGRGKRSSIPIGVSVVTKREIIPVFWLKMGGPDTVSHNHTVA